MKYLNLILLICTYTISSIAQIQKETDSTFSLLIITTRNYYCSIKNAGNRIKNDADVNIYARDYKATDLNSFIQIHRLLNNNLANYCPTYFSLNNENNSSTDESALILEFSDEPPPGFQSANEPQTTLVDIYYAGTYVGDASVTFTPTSFRFLQPAAIVNQLPDIKNKTAVIHALSGNLNPHSELVCKEKRSFDCDLLNPEIAGVIFDPSRFRATLFINGHYLTSGSSGISRLPPSDAGLSYINQVLGAASGSSNNSNGNSYNFRNIGILGFGQGRINSEISVANNTAGIYGTNQNISNIQLENLNAEYDKGEYEYKAGLLTTNGSNFYSSQDILGFSAGTSLDTLQNLDKAYGTPLEIFLPLPSQVNIYRDGRLLSSNFYNAGNQVLNTSGLPNGAYDLTLVIINASGTRTESRFYVKTTEIAPMGYPQYYVDMGLLESQQSIYQNTLPEFTHIFVYETGINKRLSTSWGIQAGLSGSTNIVFMQAGLAYIHSFYQIEPSVLVATDKDFGVGISTFWQKGKLSGSLNGRRIWVKNKPNSNLTPITPININEFDPITQNTSQASANISYPLKKVRFSFSGYMNRYDNQATNYAFGPSLSVPLYNKQRTNVRFDLSATRSTSQDVIMGTIYVNFNGDKWSAYANSGYRQSNNRQPDMLDNSGPVASAQVNWKHLNNAQEGTTLGANADTDAGIHTAGLSYQYMGSVGTYNAAVENTSGRNTSNNNLYSLNTDTRFAMANKTFAWGGYRSNKAGIIVDIESKKPGDKFEVLVNNQLYATAQTDKPLPIFLSPYRSYKVGIKDASDNFYSYDEKPKSITLYPGNMVRMTWQAAQKTIIFAKIVMPNHTPIANAIVEGGLDFNSTDDEGYLQAEVLETTHELKVVNADDQACLIHFTKPNQKEEVYNLGDLICMPVKLEQKIV